MCVPALAAAQSQYEDPGQSGNPESWHTDEFNKDWGLAAIGADHAYARGLSGKGIKTAVHDDGVAHWHSEFANRLDTITFADPGCPSRAHIAGPGACFYADGTVSYAFTDNYDQNQIDHLRRLAEQGKITPEKLKYYESLPGFRYAEHGTHVAGTIGAARDGSGMHGVAFAADMVSANFLSDTYRNFQAAMNWPGAVRYARAPGLSALRSLYDQMAEREVRAINNSWGPGRDFKTEAELDAFGENAFVQEATAIYGAAAIDNDLIQVFAAGNQSGTLASYWATLPRYLPEAEPYWLSVVNLSQDLTRSAGSSICGLSKDWCISAPGTDIYSAIPAGQISGEVVRDDHGAVLGLQVDEAEQTSSYGVKTGTSMAAPHVTGGLALLMERFPYMTSAQVRDVLLTTARDLGAPGVDEVFGWGLMDLKKAIDGPGLLRVDTDVALSRPAGGAKVWQGEAWDDWRNDIAGNGQLTKRGEGWLRLSGDNTFAGIVLKQGVLELTGANTLDAAVTVEGGVLLLDGKLINTDLTLREGRAQVQGEIRGGRTHVGAQALLSGTGRLAQAQVAGTIAPGDNGIGTLHVQGDYEQLAGSTYQVDLGEQNSDRLVVAGQARLQGGEVQATPVEATLGDHYRILDAGDVQGQFAGVQGATGSPFLKMGLSYSAKAVDLSVQRGLALASVASSDNQLATATAADQLPESSDLARTLTRLTPMQVVSSLDQINGESYASLQASLLMQGQHLNESSAQRLRMQQSAFALQRDADKRNGSWVEMNQAASRFAADGNAAAVRSQASLLSIGYDRYLGGRWMVGVNGAMGRGEQNISERSARSTFDSRNLGLYAGKRWDAFALRAGVSVSQHHVDAERRSSLGSELQTPHAQVRQTGQQAYLEGGYRFDLGSRAQLQPFLQWSQVRVRHGAFAESGGSSALQVAAQRSVVDYSTVGLDLATSLAAAGGEDWLSFGGTLAYRHATGDLTPLTSARWQGGELFAVRGTSIGPHATLFDLHLGARLSRNSLLEFGYNGAHGWNGWDHALNARFSVAF
ncbi:S8 family serine peptidase [Pseudoxanthomonas indica]|uniref:Subtilase-type serine protease n=1 Tax=Pseudoxanthomonas indica TaxID=428993 RepID=A0A1T5LPK8_9GAMM|nr:autotransporter serine protease [Pseudoxanthomonas indica]GGD37708.1 outer membrane autotransporter barrel domain-containing protein [Pseudoxanthomonas indica]SKC77882.1 subtilase-type serine protease [Pseudoxanthomonas indica]